MSRALATGRASGASWPLPEVGSDGVLVVGLCHEEALIVHAERQHRQPAAGRSEDRLGVVGEVELRLVARAEQAVRLLLVQAGGAAGVGADLGIRDIVAPHGTLVAWI